MGVNSHPMSDPTPLPDLNLSHGQVLWALARGTLPDRVLRDDVRYLRLLGVPFREAELGAGRGNRVRYRFEHLIELGVALFGLRHGMRPREVASLLTRDRKSLRSLYRSAWQKQPPTAVEQPWVKSRGAIVTLLADELFLRMHDRYSSKPGTIETVGPDELHELSDFLGMAEKYPGEKARILLPLTRLVLELVAWAQEAPEFKPGP
jgi:hypothetical protein